MKNPNKDIIFNLLKGFLITYAITNIGNIKTTDILSICIFVCSVFLLSCPKENDKKDYYICLIFSGLFTLLYSTTNISVLGGNLTNKFFVFIYTLITIIGLFLLFHQLLLIFISKYKRIRLFEKGRPFSIKLFTLLSLMFLLIMLPFFLMNYPAVMTPDSISQYRQVVGLENYSNHHPWLHTMLFKLFYDIGYFISGNIYVGIACYTFFQMIIMAVSESYVLTSLYELGLKKKWCMVLILLFVLYPYHLLYSVTIWKDIIFSASVLVFSLTLFRMYQAFINEGNLYRTVREKVLFLISGFVMCMFRHNGLYAFILTSFIIVFVLRKKCKSFLLYIGIILISCFIIKGPVMNAAYVTPGEFAYKVCIPLQQIGRVIANGRTLEQTEVEQIEKINVMEYISENYQQGGADPMFAWVLYGNKEYLEDHKAEYLKLWITIGLRYPKDYLDAYIDQTKGYWFPREPEQVVNFGITNNDDGLVSQPIFNGPVLIKINELLTKFYTMIPVYGFLYSMGGVFWFLLACLMLCYRYKRVGASISFLPVLTILLTVLIAVPLVADMRYDYPLILTAPVLCVLTFYSGENDNKVTILCDK